MTDDMEGEYLHYPYGVKPLRPAWSSTKGRLIACLAIGGAAAGVWLSHAAGRPVNEIALLALLPGGLAFTLAFSPEPPTRLGTIAKDLLCLATTGACLSGPYIHYLVGCVPAVLACAVAMDRILPPGLRVPPRYRIMNGGTPPC